MSKLKLPPTLGMFCTLIYDPSCNGPQYNVFFLHWLAVYNMVFGSII